MKTSKIVLAISTLAMLFVVGCSKSGNGRSDNSGYFANGGFGGVGGVNGTTGAVGNDQYGRFTLGLRFATGSGSIQTGGQVQASGTLRSMGNLGCQTGYYGYVQVPNGDINLGAGQPGQVTQFGQIYNVSAGANLANGLVLEVVMSTGGIQALAGTANTCLGATNNELYGMVTINLRIQGQIACQIPAYVDLQSSRSACGI